MISFWTELLRIGSTSIYCNICMLGMTKCVMLALNVIRCKIITGLIAHCFVTKHFGPAHNCYWEINFLLQFCCFNTCSKQQIYKLFTDSVTTLGQHNRKTSLKHFDYYAPFNHNGNSTSSKWLQYFITHTILWLSFFL